MTSKTIFQAKSIRARAPVASSQKVHNVMQAIPSRDTTPEKALRSILHQMGLRFRKDIEPVEDVRCKADIVFNKVKVCVFIDGCFWHGCPIHFRLPKTHSAWWLEKVEDNKKRDKKKTMEIKQRGWVVLRYWEHEIRNSNAIEVANKIYQTVKKPVHKRIFVDID